jgi:putative tryptophan/tyrosine transport system substrate-binding protein
VNQVSASRYLSRRQVVQGTGAIGLALLAGCGRLSLPGQQATKVPRIGFLAVGAREGRAPLIAAFLQGLQEVGYVEGQNVTIEYRFSDGKDERLPGLAAELVALKVDIILASGTLATVAAKQTTTTVPIVMGGSGDPVANELVASLARPGGNVTGISLLVPQVAGKRVQVLTDTVPGLSRLAVISNVTSPLHVPRDQEIEAAGRVLGIEIQILPVRSADDFEGAFQVAASSRAEAIYPGDDPLVTNARDQLAELGLRYRLPTMFAFRENVLAGGLLAYGPSFTNAYRRAAAYVDKILKGARPADLPVEQPREFDFVINFKTAQALGLTIPHHVLLQATEVIQ